MLRFFAVYFSSEAVLQGAIGLSKEDPIKKLINAKTKWYWNMHQLEN